MESDEQRGMLLLAEEQFSAGDDGFLGTLLFVHSAAALAGLVDRWRRDPRPWAKSQMRSYALMPYDQPGHEVVVKRLFKQAEADGDGELMALFLVAFDRLVRRVRKDEAFWDATTRRYERGESLKAPQNVIQSKPWEYRDPTTGRKMTIWRKTSPKQRLFRWRTRYYLQRRAWRYFRRLGFRKGASPYVELIAKALTLYSDQDLHAGENLIDSWSLMHACYGQSSRLHFSSLRASLKEGCTLAQLAPAPAFPQRWKTPEGLKAALRVVIEARSAAVRTWALDWHQQLAREVEGAPDTEDLLRLLNHADEAVQSYGASLVQNAPDAANWTLETWLKLLRSENPAIAQLLCDAMLKQVRADRLGLAQCVELACGKAVPVARMGLQFLQQRTPASDEERAVIAGLCQAKSEGMGAEIARWALGHLGIATVYHMPVVCRFFDSANAGIRFGAWQWMAEKGSPGWMDATLWSRLAETPFEDVRFRMIDALTIRTESPVLGPNDLAPVWSAVLLGIHRGGRQKLRALRQIAAAIDEHPAQREQLLPVLTAAVRSIRGPEARAALSAVLTLVARHPELEIEVTRSLPELEVAA